MPAPVRFWAEGSICVGSARVTRAEQAAFGDARAHRLPDSAERGHDAVSGAGRALARYLQRVHGGTRSRRTSKTSRTAGDI